jgi:thiamine-monophosphate kinase
LSDLAACGAKPKAFMLALSLPQVDPEWLSEFSQGLWALADEYDIDLIGGDTTRGPLNICITALGEVPTSQALLRSGAQVGDDIYVSGNLGDARLALEVFRGALQVPSAVFELARLRMEQPTPRVALGLALRGIAHAAADISDGLLGDLKHILKASGVGAVLETQQVVSTLACTSIPQNQFQIDVANQLALTLSGGDDYELVFTAAPSQRAAVAAAAKASQTDVTHIGQITASQELVLRTAEGTMLPNTFASFDHFKST